MLRTRTLCWMILVVKSLLAFNKHKAALMAALLFVLLSACSQAPQQLVLGGSTMGTSWSAKIVLQAGQALNQKALQAKLDQALIDFNQIASTYISDSEISRFNQHQSLEAFTSSKELALLIAQAKNIHQLSGGAFDITIAPLIELWGFGKTVIGQDRLPGEQSIALAQANMGSNKLNLIINHSAPTARLIKSQANITIDLSAIAKGRGVDLVAEILEQQGYQNYMVEIGGEIRANGLNSQNKAWQIAIEKPIANERSVQKVVGLRNTAIATSGDYRNFFEIDGQRYSHSINPKSGWPVKHELVSVTVLHPEAMLADAWATALIVVGPKKAMQLAEEQDLAIYLIERTSSGLKEHVNQKFADTIASATKEK